MPERIVQEQLQARAAYLAQRRQELHRHPEVGFDLPVTCEIVERELDHLGIQHTRKYGQSSVVGMLGNRTDAPVVAVRADMDALPVEEKTGLPFMSENPGFMHACGHDAHVAMLLGAARTLQPLADTLPFRLKLVFQPSEECALSGAKMMVDNGVLEDVDYVLCMHVNSQIDTGTVSYARNVANSACTPIEITFYGKTSHATMPQMGSDALAMLFKTYAGIQLMLTREIDPLEPVVCSVGAVKGGDVHNVVCDNAYMKISLRTFQMPINDFIVERVRMLATHAAQELGGSISFSSHMSAPAVVNDNWLVDRFIEAGERVLGAGNVLETRPVMGSDDFSWFSINKPSIYYWLGVRNLEKWPQTALHNNNFMLDENALLHGENLLISMLYEIAEKAPK